MPDSSLAPRLWPKQQSHISVARISVNEIDSISYYIPHKQAYRYACKS